MITFKQFIAEAFDSSYPVKYVSNDAASPSFEFTDKDDHKYKIIFFVSVDRDTDDNYIEVYFVRVKQNGSSTMRPQNDSSNSTKVYSTIANELEKFVKQSKIYDIRFEAAVAKTIPLYRAFARRIANKINGHVKEIKPDKFIISR